MRNISNKVDDSGDVLPAGDFNAWKNEAQGVVTSTGISLDPAGGPDVDLTMFKKALAIITSMGLYYDDSGSADTYVLTHPNSTQHVPAYEDGMLVFFQVATTNTGTSTIKVDTLAAKAFVNSNGTGFAAGALSALSFVLAVFRSSANRFEIVYQHKGLKMISGDEIRQLSGNLKLRLSDDAGASKFQILNNSSAEQFFMDSQANHNIKNPAFRVYRTTSLAAIATGVPTLIPWTSESFDTHNKFVSDRYTPSAGKHFLFAKASQVALSTQGRNIKLFIYKNGVAHTEGINSPQWDATFFLDPGIFVSDEVDANGTDFFEIYVLHNDSGTATLTGSITNTYFTGFKISA